MSSTAGWIRGASASALARSKKGAAGQCAGERVVAGEALEFADLGGGVAQLTLAASGPSASSTTPRCPRRGWRAVEAARGQVEQAECDPDHEEDRIEHDEERRAEQWQRQGRTDQRREWKDQRGGWAEDDAGGNGDGQRRWVASEPPALRAPVARAQPGTTRRGADDSAG